MNADEVAYELIGELTYWKFWMTVIKNFHADPRI